MGYSLQVWKQSCIPFCFVLFNVLNANEHNRKVALTLSGGHADAVYSVAWSNDGTLIATGSADRTVTIWDPKAGKVLRLLKGHEDTVKSMVFAPLNQHNPTNVLASGMSDIVFCRLDS